MGVAVNRQVILRSRPSRVPLPNHLEILTTPKPVAKAGEIQVRSVFLSVEPAMRWWVNAASNYSEPVPIGSVMRSFAAARVEASNDPSTKVGTRATGMFGWQDYAVINPAAIETVGADRSLPLSSALGVLGINGLTAHYGLLEIGMPTAGETVVVSTAAGSVGSCVGQIAKIHGCRTIGIAGGEEERKLCLDLFGFDEAINYRSSDFQQRLAQVWCNRESPPRREHGRTLDPHRGRPHR